MFLKWLLEFYPKRTDFSFFFLIEMCLIEHVMTMNEAQSVIGNVWMLDNQWYAINGNGAYLKLRSGDAHRTAMLGICGTKRIAMIT